MKLSTLGLSLIYVSLASGCSSYHPSEGEYFVDQSSAAAAPGTPVSGSAKSERLITITNDRNAIVNTLDLQLDASGNPQGILYVTNNAGSVTQKSFSAAQIGSGYGVVLEEQSGVQAVLLRGQIDSSTGQGLAAIRFITNGLNGTYSECAMRINRSPSGTWGLYNAYTSVLTTTAKIISWSLGISTFQGICKQ